MALTPQQKEAIKTRLEAGGSVRSLAKEFATTEKTVRTIKRKLPLPEGVGIPEGVSPPPSAPMSFGDEPAPPSPQVGLSGQACGDIAGLVFTIASFKLGQGWQLENGEKAELGGAISDCFPLLPAETAQKIVAAAPPVNALSILAKIIMRRLAKIAQIAAVEATKARQSAVAGVVSGPPPPPPPPMSQPQAPTTYVQPEAEPSIPPVVTEGVKQTRPTNAGVFGHRG